MKTGNTNIYTLSCPDTGCVKYVGKTIKSLNDRLSEHISECRKKIYNKRTNWIRSLVSIGKTPKIELLDQVSENWVLCEMYWISQFKTWGFELKNMTDGGEGVTGRVSSFETRLKMSKAQKGIKRNPKHIQAALLGRLHKGGFVSHPETKIKQSLALKGIPKTKEHSLKVSIANKGKKMSDEFKKNQSMRMKNKTLAAKPVVRIDHTGIEIRYSSVTEAHNKTGILITSITNCLTGRSKKAGGYKWIYLNNVAA